MLREQAAVPMSDLNTTPLVDVMLVLLIIFMISAPLLSHKLAIPMPGNPLPRSLLETPRHVIGMEAAGSGLLLTLDGAPIAPAQLQAQLRDAGRIALAEQAEYRIAAGEEVRFDAVAGLLADGRRAGLSRIGLAETRRD